MPMYEEENKEKDSFDQVMMLQRYVEQEHKYRNRLLKKETVKTKLKS